MTRWLCALAVLGSVALSTAASANPFEHYNDVPPLPQRIVWGWQSPGQPTTYYCYFWDGYPFICQ